MNILTCDVDYGILLNNNGEYQQAQKVLEQALKVSKQYFPEFVSIVYLNLCNTYMLLEDYKKCIDMCYKGIELGYNSQFLSYYLINSLFRVNRKEECLKCINEFAHLKRNEYYDMMVEFIRVYYLDESKVHEVLMRLYDFSQELSPKMRARILNLIIENEEKNNNFENAVRYYKELVEILKKN